eukprot:7449705-Pyramimonas_sp.AAC.1
MRTGPLLVFSRVLRVRPVSVCNSSFAENCRPRLHWRSWREAIFRLPGVLLEAMANCDFIAAVKAPLNPTGSWASYGCPRASAEGPACTSLLITA